MREFATTAKSVLERQITLALQLLELLKQEYETLRHAKTDNLDDFTNAKSTIVQELEQANEQWQTALKNEKVEFSLAAIKNALSQADPDKQLKLTDLWETLTDTTRQCQKQNAINGAVLTLRSQVTEQALAILRGQNPSEEQTYESTGKRSHYGTGGPLGKA